MMNDNESTRRNILIKDRHQAFLNQTNINFSAFVRRCLDEYIAYDERNGFSPSEEVLTDE